MTQFSGLWTTDAATPEGDQQASYTQAQLAIMHRIIAACSGFEGVAPGFLNELAVTGAGANTVAVNTGGAMVDGLFYHNDASQNVNIPSASGGGNTRIDRIVLRATWSLFGVRIVRIAGTNAADPFPPAITQTSGTTYDIPLAQVLVTTAGAVTVTDERVWAIVPRGGSLAVSAAGDLIVAVDGISTSRIQDEAVTAAKLAAGASKLTHRQGGSATNWNTAGTTDYTPATARMQGGVANFVSGGVTIAFPVAFSQVPLVITDAGPHSAGISSISASQVELTIIDFTGNLPASGVVRWLAFGAE